MTMLAVADQQEKLLSRGVKDSRGFLLTVTSGIVRNKPVFSGAVFFRYRVESAHFSRP